MLNSGSNGQNGIGRGVRDDEKGNICPAADVWVHSRAHVCAFSFHVDARKELILEKFNLRTKLNGNICICTLRTVVDKLFMFVM